MTPQNWDHLCTCTHNAERRANMFSVYVSILLHCSPYVCETKKKFTAFLVTTYIVNILMTLTTKDNIMDISVNT
jgi:hypothetical protein